MREARPDLTTACWQGPVGGFEDLGGDPFGNTSGHLFSPQPQSSFDGSFVSLSPDIKYPSGAPAVDLLSQPVADPFATAGISLLGQQLPAKQSFPVASDPFGFSTTTAGQAAPGHSPPTFSGFGVSQRDNPFAPAPHMQRVDPFPQPAGVPGLGAASGPPATAYAQPAVRLPQASNSRPVNPFQSSGIQPSMMTDRSKKSVHDPFAELSMIASKQGPGSGNQSAAMKVRRTRWPRAAVRRLRSCSARSHSHARSVAIRRRIMSSLQRPGSQQLVTCAWGLCSLCRAWGRSHWGTRKPSRRKAQVRKAFTLVARASCRVERSLAAASGGTKTGLIVSLTEARRLNVSFMVAEAVGCMIADKMQLC